MTSQESSPEAPITAGSREQRWRVAAVCLVLAAITIAVFGQTARFDFVNFDDNIFYENAQITGGLSLKGLAWIFTHLDCSFYHPLTMLSFMTDYQFHGLHAGWYHLTNVLLHTASVLLLFLILRQMTGALWRSAFVAAVFAIHPLRVESVAWVACRKDVLSTFFFLLTIGAYVRFARQPNSLARYLMVAAAFVLALLSKPTVMTLPFVLLLLDYWPLRRFEQPRKLSRLILEKIPLLALAAGLGVMTMLAKKNEVAPRAYGFMPARLGNAVVSYVAYLRQMVWPEGLAPFYPRPEKGDPIWMIALSLLVLAMITGGVLAFRRKRPWLLTGWLWYLVMLTPMIGLVQVVTFAHADRYTYLSQIGLYVGVTWLAAEWRASQVVLGGLMAGVLAVLMFCAWKQTRHWKNSETLWIHTLACTTDNDVAHDNFGLALLQKGSVDEAIAQYRMALQIRPDNAEANRNLGTAFLQKGRMDEAIASYQRALQIKPDFLEVLNNLSWVLAEAPQDSLRNGPKAVELAERANQMTRNENPVVLGTLAAAYAEAGRFPEAVETAQRALRLAGALSNKDLASLLQSQINLYQTGTPFHLPAPTH